MTGPALPRALDRGLQTLQLLAQHPRDGLGFGQLRRALDIPDNSLARLLQGLLEAGWITHQRQRYRSALQTQLLARPASAMEQLASNGRRIARRLREETRNTAMVIGWDGERMHCLATALHPDALRLQRVGRVARNWHQPPWGWFFKGAGHWRRCGIQKGGGGANKRDILAELARLDDVGWCLDDQRDRRRLAAPIHAGDTIVGALAVGGSAISLHDEDIPRIGAKLVDHARALESLLPTTAAGTPT